MKLIWFLYVSKNQLKDEFNDISFDSNKLNLIPKILSSATEQFFYNIPLTSSIIVIIFILFFTKKTTSPKIVPNNSLFLFVALFSLGVIMITLLAYILVFSEYEAQRAASFWRYTDPAAFILWSSIVISILNFRDYFSNKIIKISSYAISAVYLLIFFYGLNKYNFDRSIDYNFIQISSNLIQNYPENEDLFIIDLQTHGIDSIKIKYYVNEHMPINYFSSVHLKGTLSEDVIKIWFENYKNIHIHSASNKQLKIIKDFIDNLNE